MNDKPSVITVFIYTFITTASRKALVLFLHNSRNCTHKLYTQYATALYICISIQDELFNLILTQNKPSENTKFSTNFKRNG